MRLLTRLVIITPMKPAGLAQFYVGQQLGSPLSFLYRNVISPEILKGNILRWQGLQEIRAQIRRKVVVKTRRLKSFDFDIILRPE